MPPASQLTQQSSLVACINLLEACFRRSRSRSLWFSRVFFHRLQLALTCLKLAFVAPAPGLFGSGLRSPTACSLLPPSAHPPLAACFCRLQLASTCSKLASAALGAPGLFGSALRSPTTCSLLPPLDLQVSLFSPQALSTTFLSLQALLFSFLPPQALPISLLPPPAYKALLDFSLLEPSRHPSKEFAPFARSHPGVLSAQNLPPSLFASAALVRI